MTTPSATTTPAGDDLLIQEAIRQRRMRRSGKFLAGVLTLAVFFAAAGFLLAFHPGAITYSEPYSSGFPLGAVLAVVGVLFLAMAVLFLASAVSGLPDAPWGDPAPGECPVCGEPALREDDIALREGYTLTTAASSTVILCETRGCPYAAVP